MKTADALIQEAKKLSKNQQRELFEELEFIMNSGKSSISTIRKKKLETHEIACPHCGSVKVIGWGKNKYNNKRFRCKDCNKTFNEFTGSSLDKIHHKDLILKYAHYLANYESIRFTAKKLKISVPTSFAYRHRILTALNDDSNIKFEGIVESDETFFRQSEKGNRKLDRKPRKRGKSKFEKLKRGISKDKVAVIVSADRNNNLVLTKSCLGRITNENLKKSFENKITKENILCTDKHVSYLSYSMETGIKHITLNSTLKQFVKDGVYHIQHVNNNHKELKKIINQIYYGVATKYLQNYLSLFRMNQMNKNSKSISNDIMNVALNPALSYNEYKNIQTNYNQFLIDNGQKVA